jgi:hypothetical protein
MATIRPKRTKHSGASEKARRSLFCNARQISVLHEYDKLQNWPAIMAIRFVAIVCSVLVYSVHVGKRRIFQSGTVALERIYLP